MLISYDKHRQLERLREQGHFHIAFARLRVTRDVYQN
jgi:hypothetical protein